MPTEKLDALPKQHRSMPIGQIVVRAADEEAPEDSPKIFEIAVSSEYEVKRWYGRELLSHEKDAIVMDRFASGAAVLVDHSSDQVGVIERAWLDKDRVLRAEIRFSKNTRGQEIQRDVEDKIRRNVSVGYRIHEAVEEIDKEGEGHLYRITRWEPLEVSIVSVPADPTVGVDRSAGPTYPVRVLDAQAKPSNVGVNAMPDPVKQPDVPANGSAPAGDNRAANAEIARMCAANGASDQVGDFLERGLTPDQVARELLRSRATEPVPSTPRNPLAAMPDKDRRQYSYRKAILGALNESEGNGRLDGVEREVSDEWARNMPQGYKSHGGVFLPWRLNERTDDYEIRANTTAAAPQGGPTIFTERGELIDLLRDRAIVTQMGAKVFTGLSGPVGFPKIAGGLTVYWVAENPGADVTSSDAQFAIVTLNPKTLQADTAYSRQLLVQSTIDVEAFVRNELVQAHALGIDRAALHGTGAANQPTGLYVIAGVNAVAAGGVPSFGKFVDMQGAVADDNAYMGQMGYVTTPLMAAKMMQTLVAASAGSDMVWGGNVLDGQVAGFAARATNVVAKNLGAGTNEHGVLFGNWSDLLIGFFGATEIIVDPYSRKKRGLVEVTSFQMADIQVRHPESFAKMTGALVA